MASVMEKIIEIFKGCYVGGTLPDPNDNNKKKSVHAKVSDYLNPSSIDTDTFDYIANTMKYHKLVIKQATDKNKGVIKLGNGLQYNEETDTTEIKVGKGLIVNKDTGSIEAGLSLTVVTGNFTANGTTITLSNIELTPEEYMVTLPVPLESTDGTLGEIWVEKKTGSFIVHNTGSYTGKFEMSYSPL